MYAISNTHSHQHPSDPHESADGCPCDVSGTGSSPASRASMPSMARRMRSACRAGTGALIGALGFMLLVASCATPPERAPEEAAPEPPPEVTEEVPERPYEEISLFISAGDPEAAIAAYEEARLKDPEDPETLVLLARLQMVAGRLDEATDTLNQALESDPGNSEALYALGLIAGARNEEEAKLDYLERAVDADPENADAYAAIGETHLTEKRYSAARSAFENSLEADQDNFVALIGLGNVHLRQDKPEEAEEVLTQAIETQPDYPFAYSDRGRARVAQYNLAAAEEDLTKAIELEPSYSWNYLDRGRVRAQRGRFEPAIEDFSKAIERNPDVFLSYAQRARAYHGLGEVENAYQDYRQALDLKPSYYPAFAPYATVAFMKENYAAAADYFAEAYEIDRSAHSYALLSALARKFQGDHRDARAYLESVLQHIPRDTGYWAAARLYMSRSGDSMLLRYAQDEQTEAIRASLIFFLAGHYDVEGQLSLARRFYAEADRLETNQLPETQIAAWRLEHGGLVQESSE